MDAPTEHMLIGLYSPEPQSGKSTVAALLQDKHGFTTKSFAAPIKRMVTDLLYSNGIDPELVTDYMGHKKEETIPEIGASFRYLAQTLGTEWGRNLVSSNIWVDAAMGTLEDRLVVFDDVRFPNEYKAIREEGGQVWRITRTGTGTRTKHGSEGLLEGEEFDEEINNDGTLLSLVNAVDRALFGPL